MNRRNILGLSAIAASMRILGFVLTGFCCLQPGFALADDAAKQIVGTWKLISMLVKFDGGDAIQPYGSDPKGRLVITSDGYWITIITGANRGQAKNSDEKAVLLDSMLTYSGKYSIDGDRVTTHVDMSSNEIYSGANQNQTRYFNVDGDKLILRTGQIASAVRPGQKAEGTLTFVREH
jgi:Lipocalin-like domain